MEDVGARRIAASSETRLAGLCHRKGFCAPELSEGTAEPTGARKSYAWIASFDALASCAAPLDGMPPDDATLRAMRTVALKTVLLVLPLTFASAATISACVSGGTAAESKTAKVSPGEMPAGAKWAGVYYHSVYGYLHITETGTGLVGRWKTSDGTRWGELSGSTEGNLAKFEWTEHKMGMVGPSSITKGKGYFVYTRPTGDNVDDELHGEWGLEDSETGNSWDCVKQRNQKPDLKSVHGDEAPTGPSKDWK